MRAELWTGPRDPAYPEGEWKVRLDFFTEPSRHSDEPSRIVETRGAVFPSADAARAYVEQADAALNTLGFTRNERAPA